MKKIAIIWFILLVILVITVTTLVNTFVGVISDERVRLEENMGVKVVVSKDTLTVVNFNEWDSTYTLDNGLEVSDDYVEKNKID